MLPLQNILLKNEISLVLDLIPIPQRQTRVRMQCGHPRLYDPSHEDKCHIQLAARSHYPAAPLDGPVKLELDFYLQIPASTSKKKKLLMEKGLIFHEKKPDIDNLAYLVTNALKGIIYNDDSQIVKMVLSKQYAEHPRIEIKCSSVVHSHFDETAMD